MQLLEDEAPKARVEMTPIMDVIFLLLVFFIYVFMRMTVQHGLKVDLPRAEGSAVQTETLQVVITASDELLLDGRTKLSMNEAVDAVVTRTQTLDLPVILRADRNAHIGPALELMSQLRARGIERVTYQVEKAH